MNWERMASFEFDEAIKKSGGVCAIPIGCTEKHGQHLPVGSDCYEIQMCCEKAAEMEDFMIFPTTFWLGDVCGYHSRTDEVLERRKMKGGIGINPELLYRVLEELCDEIYRNGFNKILLVNGHGGNVPFLNFFVRAMLYKKRDYAVMWTSGFMQDSIYGQILDRRAEFPDLTEKDIQTLEWFKEHGSGGGHADMKEVMQIMSLDPTLVHEDKYEAESGDSTHETDYLSAAHIEAGFVWDGNFPNMYNGFPAYGCTKAIGDAAVKINAERVANAVKVLKHDDKCVAFATKKID